jgi:hypothetical protein
VYVIFEIRYIRVRSNEGLLYLKFETCSTISPFIAILDLAPYFPLNALVLVLLVEMFKLYVFATSSNKLTAF